jgi:tetratricopeptide (TPR) repeat protein
VFTSRFFGLICFSASLLAATLQAQVSAASETGISSGVPMHPASPYSMPLRTASGEGSLGSAEGSLGSGEGSFGHDPFEPGAAPLVPDISQPRTARPISGFVSLRELQHPIPKKAIRAAYQAQRLADANKVEKAIVKFKDAIRIYPAFRDAHLNLGVQYARVGRGAEARAEFQKALDIGPPAAPIYNDLALISLNFHQYRDAEDFARRALALDPGNGSAQAVLKMALTH